MSIETEIASLTTAIRNLTDVLLASAAKALPAATATFTAPAPAPEPTPAPAPEPKKTVKKEPDPTELELFQKRLSSHDWTYGMSDDPRVNRAGESAEAALKSEAARGGKEFLAAYEAARAKAWKQPEPTPAPAPTVSEDDLRVQIVELARPNMGDAAHLPTLLAAINNQLGK